MNIIFTRLSTFNLCSSGIFHIPTTQDIFTVTSIARAEQRKDLTGMSLDIGVRRVTSDSELDGVLLVL